MQSYELGTELVLATTFYDAATGDPAEPTTVTLRVMDPGGNAMVLATSNTAVGTHKTLFTPAIAGIWIVRWEGIGAVVAASEHRFEVKPSVFAPGGQQ